MKTFRIHIAAAIILTILFVSCSETINDVVIPNQAPETHVFIYTQDTVQLSQQKSRLKVHWWGDDPDGIVQGFFIKWEGLDDGWTFTAKNDSVFSLPIGTADTTYTFWVTAVDADGNGKYDETISQNGNDFGAEPFQDANENAKYDVGEDFLDLGLTDATPATQKFPIKNSSPVIGWNDFSVLPAHSFPIITVGWKASDLDGDESIEKINLALNDTTDFISLEGFTRLITLRIDDVNSSDPMFEILINGNKNQIFSEKLGNISFGNPNKLYLQAVDISGAKSNFTALPDTNSTWIIDRPKGKLLIIDDYPSGASAESFYDNSFSQMASGALAGKFDKLNFDESPLPYPSLTFPETIKLFDYIFWYSDTEPNLGLMSLVTNDFVQNGGKIAFSTTFKDSNANFNFTVSDLQLFLPVDSLAQNKSGVVLFPGAKLIPVISGGNYPQLETSLGIGFVRTFYPNQGTADEIYDLSSSRLNGNIAFMNKDKSLFFIGLPLDRCNKKKNVPALLEQVFISEFGMSK